MVRSTPGTLRPEPRAVGPLIVSSSVGLCSFSAKRVATMPTTPGCQSLCQSTIDDSQCPSSDSRSYSWRAWALSSWVSQCTRLAPEDLVGWPAATGYAVAAGLGRRGIEPRLMDLPRRG